MKRPTFYVLTQVLCCLAVAAVATSVCAEDEAAGRVLFNDAMVLSKRGALDEACPKFEESLRQSYNLNAHYFLADCLERQGKTATAWTTFLSAASKAKAVGETRREQTARKRADALEQKLVRLRVVVSREVDGLEVRRNGTLVGKPMWGALVPVDPGEVEFTASAPKFETYRTTINVFGEGRILDVTIPRLARRSEPLAATEPKTPIPAPRTVTVPVISPVTPVAETRADPPRSEGHSALPTIGWVIGGAGVLTLAGGGVLALIAKNSFNSAKSAFDACKDNACDKRTQADESSAIRKANWATGLVIGGAIATAVGAVFVIAGSGESDATHPSVAVGVSPAGVSFAGRF